MNPQENYFEGASDPSARAFTQDFSRLDAENLGLYTFDFGIGFNHVIQDFNDDFEVIEMRVTSIFAEAWWT